MTNQYIIEGIILRRLHEKRIEGYTLEMSKEIAEALAALQPADSATPLTPLAAQSRADLNQWIDEKRSELANSAPDAWVEAKKEIDAGWPDSAPAEYEIAPNKVTLWRILRKHGIPLDRAQWVCNEALNAGVIGIPPTPAQEPAGTKPDAKTISAAYSDWAWEKEGTAVGLMLPNDSARAGFFAGAKWACSLSRPNQPNTKD